MDPHVIAASECRRERWRNGLGWTREIVHCGGEQGWDWRLSIAEIDGDVPFSPFPGIDRELVLLSGDGFSLRFDDGEVAGLVPPYPRHRFAGERALCSEVTAGPVEVFNLMWRRDRFSADLRQRTLDGTMAVIPENGETWAVHLTAGHACLGNGSQLPTLTAGDTALLGARSDGRKPYRIDGDGEALLVRIKQLGS